MKLWLDIMKLITDFSCKYGFNVLNLVLIGGLLYKIGWNHLAHIQADIKETKEGIKDINIGLEELKKSIDNLIVKTTVREEICNERHKRKPRR